MLRQLALLLLAATAAVHVAHADDPATSYYLIGNSLTWDTVPSKLDGDVQWHVDCGKSLPFIYEHPEAPCVKSSKLWPTALQEKQYDVVSVQTHYGATLDEDAAVISKWLAMQPTAIFVIHTGWARSATRVEEYAEQNAAGQMAHSPAYITALLTKLQEQHPNRIFRQTHAIDLLAKIAADIVAQKAPLQDVAELHRDAIHMKLDSGRYLMHNAMRRALNQPNSEVGFESLDKEMKKYLDSVLESLPQR
ncbi:MAG: hypothetical protein H6823_19565 [Planctomycetaceae bacterium]|nr:hypothetical protein [Planctomycetales bacterium]MCA9170578.1 hypothetical protein [Planctomycetales bacterium]MCB9940445.1 hypothetical protein [Planctomycetaceae bacterium]